MSDWHNTEYELPNVGWPVIGVDKSGRKVPMIYGEDGDGGLCWSVHVPSAEIPGGDYLKAEFTPVRWRYQNTIRTCGEEWIGAGRQ